MLDIDHINGDGFDNTVTNLREVTVKANNENKKKSLSNSSGVTGVFVGSGSENYVAAIWKVDRRTRLKKFSITKYGVMVAFKLACDYRDAMIKELNSQGANYTERHGK